MSDRPGFFTRAAMAAGLSMRLLFSREARSNFSNSGTLLSPTDALLQAWGLSSRSGASVTENTAFNVSVFASCVNILSQSIAMLPLRVGQKTKNGPTDKPDHAASQLLKRKPGPAQTAYQWKSLQMTNVCLGGNGYSQIIRDSYFAPAAIVPLITHEVQPRLLESGRMAYIYRGVTLQDYEVLHLRALSSNGYTGRSPLRDMRDSLGLSMTAQEFTCRTFANGNRMPGIFEGGAGTTPDKAREFKKFWEDNYAGAGNAGKTPLLIGGVTWKEAGFSNQDAELLMSRRFEVEEISRHFRVPLHLLNSTEKSTTWGSGIDQLNQGFVTYTLQPWLENWEQELEDKLLSEAEKLDGYFIKFNLDGLLRGTPATRAAFYQVMRQIAAMDVNQIRTLEDWELYPDATSGDPRQPLNSQASNPALPEPDPANKPAAEDN